jgi:DNA-binding NarL/FixJ family response regulator
MIHVGIAAPTPALRAGLRAMLAGSAAQVAAEAAGLLPLAAHFGTIDVVLLADEALLDDLSEIDLSIGAPALLLLAESSRSAAHMRTLPLRAWGIVPLDATPETIQAALAATAQGLVVLGALLAEHALDQGVAMTSDSDTSSSEPLTAREREVLTLISQGLPNKLIARQLQISEHTVKFHISSIYTKLGVSNRTEAVSRGARRGLVSF